MRQKRVYLMNWLNKKIKKIKGADTSHVCSLNLCGWVGFEPTPEGYLQLTNRRFRLFLAIHHTFLFTGSNGPLLLQRQPSAIVGIEPTMVRNASPLTTSWVPTSFMFITGAWECAKKKNKKKARQTVWCLPRFLILCGRGFHGSGPEGSRTPVRK